MPADAAVSANPCTRLRLQEACRNDRSSLGPVSWVVRLLRLAVGLRPAYASAGGLTTATACLKSEFLHMPLKSC